MTPNDPAAYKAARATLGLTSKQAGAWLGVSPRTADNYAAKGLPGPAARAVGMAVALARLPRYESVILEKNGFAVDVEYDLNDAGEVALWSGLAPLLPTFSAGAQK